MTAQLVVAGADRTCDTTGVVVVVGRQSVKETGKPGYLAADLETAQPAGIVSAFDPVSVSVDGQSRHAGTVTDTRVRHATGDDGRTIAVQPITSMGPLASWGADVIGDEPWPAETVAARANRIAALIGQPLVVEGGQDLAVVPLDVDRRPARELLTELADSTGGWLFDHAGVVHLQALDARKVTALTARWTDEPLGGTWDQLDAGTWDQDDAPSPASPIVLDCSEVAWEPDLTQSAEVSTVVTVTYGVEDPVTEDRPTVTVRDDAAADLYGDRLMELDSQLLDEADALTLASTVLGRASRPQWALGSVLVDFDLVTADNAARLAVVQPGARITITGLPQPSPLAAFPGALEGWTETVTGETRTMTLHLSHVSHSLAVPTWEAEPAGETWDQLDPTATWEADL